MASERQALKLSQETVVLIQVNTSCHVVTLLIGMHCQQEDRMLESIVPHFSSEGRQESEGNLQAHAFDIYHSILTA